MFKQFRRRETLALGELALFVATWLLALVTTMGDYADRNSDAAKNSVAAIDDRPAAGSSSLD